MIWFVWVLWHINPCRLFNAESILCTYAIPFQTFQFSICTELKCHKHFYFKLFTLVNKVKWFKVLLCITDISIEHQSFIY